jgi:hypothetical protein
MVAIRERLFVSELAAKWPAPASHSTSDTADFPGEQSDAGFAVSFEFDDPGAGHSKLALVTAQTQSFRAALLREQAAIQDWFARQHWLPDSRPDLHVIVSERFRISKSLVPAWSGQRGRMEFPTSRVAAGKAAIAHELVHVYFPNANRLLAEGLAIYLQAEIGHNPAFPNFDAPLHVLARDILAEIVPGSFRDRHGSIANLAPSRLADLDAIATPNPLTLTVGANFYGEEPHGQRVVYAIAGSFAAFLIETHGVAKFRDLYMQTPFQPQVCDAGALGRWTDVYRLSLTELEVEWKSMIANCDHADATR